MDSLFYLLPGLTLVSDLPVFIEYQREGKARRREGRKLKREKKARKEKKKKKEEGQKQSSHRNCTNAINLKLQTFHFMPGEGCINLYTASLGFIPY